MRRPLTLLSVALLAVGLVTAGCGSSPIAGDAKPGSTTEPLSDPTEAGDPTESPSWTETPTVNLEIRIRIVNLWSPDGGATGGAIDVWNGPPAYGSTKVQTVPYGQATEFFQPAVKALSGGSRPDRFDFGFYPAGKTSETDMIINVGQPDASGTMVTMMLTPGGYMASFFDKGGQTAKPPADKAFLQLVNGRSLPSNSDSSEPTVNFSAVKNGKCLTYLEPETGKPNDDPSPMGYTGGTQSLRYLVDPQQDVGLITITDDDSEGRDVTCAKAPFTTVQPQLAAGEGAYCFIYGKDPEHLETLVLPVGR